MKIVFRYLRRDLLRDLGCFSRIFLKETKAIGDVYRNSGSFW
jgi:hypothetical protein